MRTWIWVVGLGLTASACGTASAVDGDLVLSCDTSYLVLGGSGAIFYATATADELPGAFTAFYCDYVDQAGRPVELPSLCVAGPQCATASNVVWSDGRRQYDQRAGGRNVLVRVRQCGG